mgnify:CR=1 FL=1
MALGADFLDAFKKELLDEVRTYSEASLKSEDLIKTKDWLEKTIESLMKSMTRDAEEKMGRALTQLNRFRDEIAQDAGQFRNDMQELRGHIGETMDEKLAALLGGLQQRLDFEQVRESVFTQIAETAKQTTDAARADIENLQDLIRNILVAMEEAREHELDPGAVQESLQQTLNQQLDQAVERLEQRVAGGAGEAVAAAAAVEQKLTKRDAGLQDALEAIQETLDKLLKRGPGLGLGDMLGGGLMNLFGSRAEGEDPPPPAADETRRLGHSATRAARPRKRPGPSGAVEAAQVRRLSYLLGKTVTRAIEDHEGNLIADQGDVVDEDMIRVARDTHKVLDLIRAVDLSRH